MLRSRAIARPMFRLALLAVLLLALAPSISRVLAGGAPAVIAGWSDLCTSMGLKNLASDARPSGDAPSPLPAMPHATGDCAYCPLAASLPLLLLACLLLPRLVGPHASRPPPAPPRRRRDNLRGLGSRGPPRLA